MGHASGITEGDPVKTMWFGLMMGVLLAFAALAGYAAYKSYTLELPKQHVEDPAVVAMAAVSDMAHAEEVSITEIHAVKTTCPEPDRCIVSIKGDSSQGKFSITVPMRRTQWRVGPVSPN